MRARSLILLIVAIVLAGGTALLARSWLAAQRTKEVESAAPIALPTPAKSVLVARVNLNRGQILRPDDLVWQPWPEGAVAKDYIMIGGPNKPETYAGWVTKNPITAGDPITESKIVKPGGRDFLAAVLRPGMRAVTIAVNTPAGQAGFIWPGDHVDLVLTYSFSVKSDNLEESHKAAQTMMRDLRVIAIEQMLDGKPGIPVKFSNATFEVTPKQAEQLALATTLGGQLWLNLRSLAPDPNQPEDKPAAASGTQKTGFAERDTSLAATAPGLAPTPAVGSGGTAPVTVISSRPTAAASQLQVAQNAAGAATATEVAVTAKPRAVEIGGDNSVASSATYSVDSELSTLIPPLRKPDEATGELWICKGPAIGCISRKQAQELLNTAAKAAGETGKKVNVQGY